MYESLITPPSSGAKTTGPAPSGPVSIDAALAAEGVTGRAAEFIKSVYQQESGSGSNTKTSNAGAVGGMQIIPATFKSVADSGWDINNPEHNLRAGIRYARQGFEAAGGDPALAGAYYYGGPGGMAKARQGVAVSDPRNPRAPNTLQYGQQVASRMGGTPALSAVQPPAAKPPADDQFYAPQRGQYASLITPPVASRTIGAAINDTVIDAANATAGLVKSGIDLFAPDSGASKFIDDEIIKAGQEKQSDYKKGLRQKLADDLKDAGQNDGTTSSQIDAEVRKAGIQLSHAFTQDPLGTVGEIFGNIGPFAVLGRGMEAAKLATGVRTAISSAVAGGMSAGEVRGNIWERISSMPDAELAKASPAYVELRQRGMSEMDAKRELGANIQRNFPEVAVTGLIGALSGKFGPEAMAAGVAPKYAGGRAGAAALGFLDEGPLQGGSEQVASNVGVQRAIPGQSLLEDVGQNIVAEGIPGMAMGAAFGGHGNAYVSKPSDRPELKPVVDKAAEGGVLSKAAVAGVDATPQQVEAPQPVDPISERVAEVEALVRQNGVLNTMRQIGQPNGLTAKEFLEALAIAKNPKLDPLQRQFALESVEAGLSWAQDGKMPGLSSERGLATTEQQPQPGTELPTQQGGQLSTQGPADFFDPNTVDVEATRVDNMIGGPRAIEGPRARLGMDQDVSTQPQNFDTTERRVDAANTTEQPAAQPAPEMAAPAAQDIPASAVQQTVEQATEGMPRVQIPAATAEDARTGNATAARRKRRAQVEQLVGAGFETVERRDSQFVLKNAKTKQEVILDGAVEAQLARAAIARMVADKANTAAASPLNDRLEPTEAQIRAGNYKKSDVIDLNGMKITIENPAGSTRRGVSPDGKAWETKMAHHYGEFLGTEGADGDRLDVFIGPRPDSDKVYVIDQKNKDGSFDESKVVMGATTEEQARQVYLSNYEPGWDGLGAITEMSLDDFKAWAKSERAKQPLMLGKQDKVITVNDGGNPVQILPLDTTEVGEASAQRGGKGKPVSKKDADLIKSIAAIFGVDAQFFRPITPGFDGDGFFNGGNTLFINERTTVTPLAIFGHEFMHLIKERMPQAYDSIAKVVSANVKDPKGYRADYYGKAYADEKGDAALTPAELEELVSDLNGNLMTDAKFWRDVFAQVAKDHGKEAKGIIARLSAFLGNAIDMVVSGLKGGRFNAGQFVNNTKDIRAAFKDGLAQYLAASDISKTAMQAELLRAQQKNRSTEIKRSERRQAEEPGILDSAYGIKRLDGSYPRQVGNVTGVVSRFKKKSDADAQAKWLNANSRDHAHFVETEDTDIGAKGWHRVMEYRIDGEPLRASATSIANANIRKSTARPTDGLTVEGYHFSKEARPALTTGAYGTGLQGSDRDEIMAAKDGRLKQRLSFYVNKGTGVRPESGVGGIAHKAELTNLYDADADTKRLKQGRGKRDFESAVLDAGYSGYLTRLDGSQPGQAILLGSRVIQPEVLGPRTQIPEAKVVPAPAQRDMDLGDKIAADKSLPSGSPTASRWAQILMTTMPEDAAKLMDLGVFDGNENLYKDELVARIRKAQPQIKKSAERAKQEYAEVESKFKDTDAWMKAPNGQATRLTERQWVQTRTPSFAKWFGPWEDAAKKGDLWSRDDVSKVVDENGEPLVVYHGTTNGGFTEFNEPGGTKRGDLGIFATDNWDMARSYVRKGGVKEIKLPDANLDRAGLEAAGFEFNEIDGGIELLAPNGFQLDGKYENDFVIQDEAEAIAVANEYWEVNQDNIGNQPGIYALFLSIKTPNEANFEGALWSGERDHQWIVEFAGEQQYTGDGKGYFDSKEEAAEFATTFVNPDENEDPLDYVRGADEHYEDTDSVVREAIRSKNDGAIIRQVIDDGGGPGGYDMTPADVYVALSPEQVKSAQFNGGVFDPSDRDIRKSAARQDPAIGDKTDVSKLPAGREVPESVAVGGLESSLGMARAKSYRRGRDLKVDIQAAVLAAAKEAKVRLTDKTKAMHKFLAGMVVNDAEYALQSNENAVGWYDQKVSRALGALSTIHPEIDEDPRSRLAFLWALATTSNGLKVDKNFELAEKAYSTWKRTGKMPTKYGIGNAAQAINKGLDYYNELAPKIGDERLLKFMSTMFTVGEINRMLGVKPGGEWMGTPVRGAAILGPKIGNGFFSSLNGYFDALTMDRWLMRTWGRMTGTLIDFDPKAITKSRNKLAAASSAMTAMERKQFGELIGARIPASPTKAQLDAIAKASQKASMKTDKREVMMSTDTMNTMRKATNLHHMTLDGQKEAPSGPAERNWVRAVFQTALEQLRANGKDMTMSDLQALLWYPERRLYDAAKSDEDVANGYEDDEAPDYANAGMNLAIERGVSRTRVLAAMDAAEARGTVQGEQLTEAEKATMLEELRQPPAQPVQLAFEVAPDPNNEELTKQWSDLPAAEKARITKLVKDAVLSEVVDAIGAKIGKTVSAIGGYMGKINPNLIAEYKQTQVPMEQARALAAAIGMALDQDSVALVDPRVTQSNGIVRITLATDAGKVSQELFAAISSAVPEVNAFTARGKNFDVLNFTGMSTEELAGKIDEAVATLLDEGGTEYVVSYGDVKSELIEKDTYASEIEKPRPGSGREILGRIEGARDRAREIIAAELGRRPAGEVPGRAGDARRADAGAEVKLPSARDGSGRAGAGQEADRSLAASERAAAQEALSPLPGAPVIKGATGPDPKLVSVAEKYARDNGITLRRQAEYVKVDPERAKRIADAYEAMPHDPQNPRVKEAYQNLIKQTWAQYDALAAAGYKFWFMDMGRSDNQEYASTPWNAMRDVRANQQMGVFPTADGFGTQEDFTPDSNPLLEDTGLRWPVGSASERRTAPVLANDLFRAVHDAFGHGLEGSGFRAEGEENAWQAHVRLFTGSAVGAITTETRGQNSFLNYGPHGEKNRTAKVEDTVFADQKTGLLPEWTWNEGRADDAPQYNARIDSIKELISCLRK